MAAELRNPASAAGLSSQSVSRVEGRDFLAVESCTLITELLYGIPFKCNLVLVLVLGLFVCLFLIWGGKLSPKEGEV